ncbi:MAG: acyltransferase family protein [Aeromicrobium sp.]
MSPAPAGVRRRTRDDVPATIGTHVLRTDIQALRAFAVMSVVLYHLWPHRLTGGFVGVDIFFVISGFLITGHLVRDVERNGTVRLGRFWAARARRLLPASLLVLLLTAIAVLTVVPRSLKDQFLSEVIASAAYVQNWKLASDAVDYLSADNLPSASQHFWSLSVEEQFYVFLPLLFLVSLLAARLLRVGRVRVLVVVLCLVTVVSFAYCLYLTDTNPGVAYFSTFTRMWEFGLGGLASFAPPAMAGLSRRRTAVVTVIAAGGVLAILASLVLIDARTPFPGYAAALPVLGTAVLVRWGGPTFVSWIGALPPVALLGRVSYALYLWHWPLIVLPPLITFHPLTTTEKLAVIVVAVAVAWASTRFFEEPIRFGLAPRARPVLVLAAVVVAMIPVMAVSLTGREVVREEATRLAAESARFEQDQPDCFGAASVDPDQPGCENPALADRIVPNPSEAGQDQPGKPGCWSPHGVEVVNVCALGPETGYDLHLFAVGDSHGLAMAPALEAVAVANNWRIDLAGHAGCYWTTADLKLNSEVENASCRDWRTNLATYLDGATGLDAVIATHATTVGIQRPPSGTSREQAIVDGLVGAWSTQTERGIPVIGLVDNPQTQDDNTQCVERFGLTDPDRCATPQGVALKRFDGNAEAAAQLAPTAVVDMTPFYCQSEVCPSVIGGVAVYRDKSHLTRTYVLTLAPYLSQRLEAALRDVDVLSGDD